MSEQVEKRSPANPGIPGTKFVVYASISHCKGKLS